MHFEEIWEEAENLSEELPRQSQEEIAGRLAYHAKNLETGVFGLKERGELIGEILFELCAYCKAEEKNGKIINSAAALKLIIDRKKEFLMEEEGQ